MKNSIIFALGCAGTLFVVAGCSSGGAKGDLATINGETIGRQDFNDYLERMSTVKVQTPQGVVNARPAGSLGLQALTGLVMDRVTLQLAKDEQVMPTEADVAKELEYQKKRNPNFLSTLNANGFSLDDIRKMITLSLANERLVTKGITIKPSEVDQYIKDNPDKFRDPEQIASLWVVVPNEQIKAQVDKDLAAGQSFQSVATRYSTAPNARAMNGAYNVTSADAMTKALADLLDTTPEMKATPWERVPDGWAKWYVQKKTPSKPIPIDDTVKENVRRDLALQRGRAATDLERRIVEKLSQAKVDIQDPTYKRAFEQQLDQIRNSLLQNGGSLPAAPATPATTPPATPAPANTGKG